jgi:DNA repair protein RecO (recombination protein O)
MQKDLKTSFTLSYFSELIEEFSPTRAKNDILYRLLLSILHALKKGGDVNFLTRYFEVWLLKISGVLPDFKKCKKCGNPFTNRGWLSPKKDGFFCNQCAPQKKEEIMPELGSFVQWTKKNPPSQKVPLSFSPQQLEAIKKTLNSLIIFHLEKKPKTLRYL